MATADVYTHVLALKVTAANEQDRAQVKELAQAVQGYTELIKHRYDQHKPTILISNLPLDQLKEHLGDALTDRIRHATGNGKFVLQFRGESYRRTTGENYLVETVS